MNFPVLSKIAHAWRRFKKSADYAYELQRLLPSGVYLDVSSTGAWRLKSLAGNDVYMADSYGMPVWSTEYAKLEDLVHALFKNSKLMLNDYSWTCIDNPLHRCQSLEEARVKKDLLEHS